MSTSDFIPFHHLHRRLGLNMAVRACAVGLLAGLTVSAFRLCLDGVVMAQGAVVGWAGGWGGGGGVGVMGMVAAAGTAAVAVGLGVWLVGRLAPEASGSGIPQIEAALDTGVRIRWVRVLGVKFLSGLACVGSGLMLGREGPAVQMGGAWGEVAALKLGDAHRRLLIAAGAGAGLAAVFNAPLAGMIFVVEELRMRVQVRAMIAGLLACSSADAVVHALLGSGVQIPITLTGSVPLGVLPGMAAVGVGAAVLAVAYNRGLMATVLGLGRIDRVPRWAKAAVIAAVIAAFGVFWPGAVGEGRGVIQIALDNQAGLWLLVGLMVVRYAGSLLSYGSGAVGGIFSPLLALGALLGLIVYHGAAWVGLDAGLGPDLWIVAGIAALFAGVVRAPLTGIVLMLELTLVSDLILPLFVAAGVAYGITNALRLEPIYESLGERGPAAAVVRRIEKH